MRVPAGMSRPGDITGPERPVEVEGVPDQEGVETSDAADRVDMDPAQQPNYTDPDRPDLT